MIKSIRWRLFSGISILIIFFVVFSWVLNTMYLEKYYISNKESFLIDNYQTIDDKFKGNPLDIAIDLEKTRRTTGIDITIIDKESNLKYSTSPRFFNRPGMEIEHMPMLDSIISKAQGLAVGDYYIENIPDRRIKTNFLNLVAKLKNGDYLLLSTPIVAIHQNVEITNKFSLLTGILTFIIGIIFLYFFSRRFTRPFIELNDIAQRISKLDFSKKYNVNSKDEIGELGQSINSLSEQLDKSISELQQANAKLLEDIERERKIDVMRKEFVSNVSHELKTPIALIQGYAEGLKVNVIEDEENKNYYCEVIIDESRKMDKLVKELLELSLIESGYLKLDKEKFDISLLIDDVLDKYRLIFAEKNIKLQIEKEKNLLVYGDVGRIEQVLVNYINNAIDHMDENKILSFTIKNVNGKARVAVFNSGQGIPDEFLSDIWKSFYKLDKARTRAHGGTGLGLSIVKGIMELHNNNCGALNKSHGIEFWFELDC